MRLVKSSDGKTVAVSTTRWGELGDSVCMAGQISAALGARTDFHLLNPTTSGQYFTMGDYRGQPLGGAEGHPQTGSARRPPRNRASTNQMFPSSALACTLLDRLAATQQCQLYYS